jgi:hypothetical protein
VARNDTSSDRPFRLLTRFVIGTVAAILIPAFVVLALAPMLLVLTPVAFVALPFMLAAFAGEAGESMPPIASPTVHTHSFARPLAIERRPWLRPV